MTRSLVGEIAPTKRTYDGGVAEPRASESSLKALESDHTTVYVVSSPTFGGIGPRLVNVPLQRASRAESERSARSFTSARVFVSIAPPASLAPAGPRAEIDALIPNDGFFSAYTPVPGPRTFTENCFCPRAPGSIVASEPSALLSHTIVPSCAR